MRIDAHQHYWQPARGDYAWLAGAPAVLQRDYGPADLAPLLRRHGIAGTVLVQAAPTAAETDFLLDIATREPSVLGVVGWVDMLAPSAPDRLATLARHPQFRGIRPMLQDIPDPGWMLQPALGPCLRALVELDLTFDALVRPVHLPNLLALLERHPDLRVVIDHGGKPDIAAGPGSAVAQAWRTGISRIAAATGAHCKLSGLVTEAAADWRDDDIRPYADHLLARFGPDRLMWGSDWPVLLLAGDHDRWSELTDQLLGGATADARAAVLGGTARRFYRLQPR